MKKIIIIGSNGKIGNRLVKELGSNNIIYTDEKKNLDNLINKDFINSKKIDAIINCIGSYKDNKSFYVSNFYVPGLISKRLSDFNNFLSKEITFIHISSKGVNDPYSSFNLRPINLEINKKTKINYDLYEFSKSAAEFIIKNNLENKENITTILLKPSNLIFKKSNFLFKLKIFLIFFPFKFPQGKKIPLTSINYLNKKISFYLNKNFKDSIFSTNIYSRMKLSEIMGNYKFLNKFKITMNDKSAIFIIRALPEVSFFRSIKRILIFIFFL